jgi:photosystem II stability/assembly factor-like uncharacterized protein
MNIYNLAFLWYIPIISGLLFQFLSCNQSPGSPQASHLPDNQHKQKSDKTGTANIVFKSTDGGQTWQDISEGLPEPVTDDNGVGRNDFFADDNGLWLSAGDGIYHSKPNSAAPFWEKEIIPGKHSSIAPGKAGIYAYNYGGGGIFHKANGTGVWSPVFTNFQEKRIFSIFETAGGTIFIGSDRGLFKSTNSGKSWKQLPIGGGGKIVESNAVLLATSEAGILRSADDGENWAVVISEGGVGINAECIEGGFAAINYSTAAKTRRIRTSYDGGKTWQPIDAGFPGQAIIDSPLPPINAGNPAQGNADSSWHPKESIPPVPEYKTSIIQVGENFFCGHTDGIYRSSDKGKTWKLVRCAEEGKMFKLYVSGNVIYAIQVESHC